MSTDTTTETAIEAAERLDTAVAELVREQAMSRLWENDYKAHKAMALADLMALGRDEWTVLGTGTIAWRVTGGRYEWQAAYEALRAAVLSLFEYVGEGPLISHAAIRELEALREAAAVVPGRGEPSAPWLDVKPARELPPVVEEAYQNGAREAVAMLRVKMETARDDAPLTESEGFALALYIEEVEDEMLGGRADDD